MIADPKIQGKNGIFKFTYFVSRGLFDYKESFDIVYPSDYDLKTFKHKPRKRVWMFVMILKREPPVIRLLGDALTETSGEDEGGRLLNIWTNPRLFDPLELQMPSDMWNQRLFKALGSKVGLKGGIKREAERLGLRYGIFPSAFDVTFSIGADRCSEGECKRCPFGDNKLCHKGKERDCNIVNWVHSFYDYQSLCHASSCPIGKDYGVGLCSRELDGSVSH